MIAIAKDVKIQVEFNLAKVESYYKWLLNNEDFNDDNKDAS
ncbi:MAG: DUF3520 domain-containing protein [Helicobacteraceae bacterium]|nr:DUF3520 domain-containing protein [Helicobacteraceae bacterium]